MDNESIGLAITKSIPHIVLKGRVTLRSSVFKNPSDSVLRPDSNWHSSASQIPIAGAPILKNQGSKSGIGAQPGNNHAANTDYGNTPHRRMMLSSSHEATQRQLAVGREGHATFGQDGISEDRFAYNKITHMGFQKRTIHQADLSGWPDIQNSLYPSLRSYLSVISMTWLTKYLDCLVSTLTKM
jgi:hypothetical protein